MRCVADGGVDHRAGEAAVLHGGRHQAADAGKIGAVLEDHDVDRSGGRSVDGVEHTLRGSRSLFVLFLLEQDRDGRARELGGEERPYVVGHVIPLSIKLFHGVGDGRDFN